MTVRVARTQGQRLARALPIVVAFGLLAACATPGSSGSAQVVSATPNATAPSVSSTSPGNPGSTPSFEPTAAEPVEFEPPAAACPAPPNAVTIPDVMVSIGAGPAIVATRGSSSVVTCSTVGSDDVAAVDPRQGLVAHPGDVITLSLPAGWRFLHWEGSDRPAAGEGANVWLGAATPARPDRIEVPVPIRPGDSIAAYTLWVIGAEDRAIGNLEILIRVRIG
ncbi:MAG: hypothetical protein QOD78_251 [Chloroflexota bacterium]|nr:hypothetical protein [Chloroflexota bacterium]